MSQMSLRFGHGLGDCVHFAYLLQLYRVRNWDVTVQYDQDKAFIWNAAEIPYAQCPQKENIHQWSYSPGFNKPLPDCEGTGNKVYLNLNQAPLARIGDADPLWRELMDVSIRGDAAVARHHWDDVDSFLSNLPAPYILLHTHGNTFSDFKNLSDDTVKELYELLLAATAGSLILLDWDQRVPKLPHSRVRHLTDDWGHMSLEHLFCLMRRSDLLIGIDSGPWHLSRVAGIPGVGVFHRHHPACVCLPRTNAVHMTPARSADRHVNIQRRRLWNIIEYEGDDPVAEDIALHSLRMLEGPRYLSDSKRLGLDVAMQQWVRDWSRGSTGLSRYADRNSTLDYLLQEVTSRHDNPVMVETGCIRSIEDWAGAGNSTYLFSAYLYGLGSGKLYSIDNDERHCSFAQSSIGQWEANVQIECADSVRWLNEYSGRIDLLYLDSMDVGCEGHAEHCLAEFNASRKNLHENSLVVVDDTTWNKGWAGKGAELVPKLLNEGWKIKSSGYQVVLSK